MNIEALWSYMQVELEADKFGNEMKQSPKRKLLLKNSEFLKEQQTLNAKIEGDIASINDRLTEIKAEIERLTTLLSEHKAKLDAEPPKTLQDVKEASNAINKIVGALTAYTKELQKLQKETESKDQRQREIRSRAVKAKQEYDAVKQEYDKEFAVDKVKLKKLRDTAEAEAAKLDPNDLAEYKTIKQRITPPIARLSDNNQCMGCFVSLPLGTLREVKTSGKIKKCDNCGRILYVTD